MSLNKAYDSNDLKIVKLQKQSSLAKSKFPKSGDIGVNAESMKGRERGREENI